MSRGPSVCHICESDGGGGAAKAAYRLHAALKEAGVRSSMCVLRKQTSDRDVHTIETKRWIFRRVRRRFRKWRNHREFLRYEGGLSKDLEVFTSGQGIFGYDLVDSLPQADIYNLHWFHHLVSLPELFKKIGSEGRLVWRMPDMNPFTGGCHYSFDCDRYAASCGACPLLGSGLDNDYSRKIFRMKQRALGQLDPSRVRIVAISNWQRECARASSLLGGFDIRVIHPGVDCRVFEPRNKRAARMALGIGPEERVVCFTAESLENRRKGFDLLVKGLLLQRDRLSNVTLLSIGNRRCDVDLPFRQIHLGRLEREEQLAEAYSASDVFVLPARGEAFGQVVIEAMACGVPVVSFKVGGLPDIVQEGEHGYLCEAEDAEALGDAIVRVLEDDERHARMSGRCRQRVLHNFNTALQAEKYMELYEELYRESMR